MSHRSADKRNLRPGGPTQGRMCRPFRPQTQCFLHSGGLRHRQRMCRASSPKETPNFKRRKRGIGDWFKDTSLTFRVVIIAYIETRCFFSNRFLTSQKNHCRARPSSFSDQTQSDSPSLYLPDVPSFRRRQLFRIVHEKSFRRESVPYS